MIKNVDISFSTLKFDEYGNFIIKKSVVNQDLKLIVANVYGPNTDSPSFFENVQKICLEMAEDVTPVLIAGDLNIALNSEIDTYNYVRENNVQARNCVRAFMQENNMVDVFRDLNGDVRRYTCRVKRPIVKQARLDYFIASDTLVPFITQASIVSGYRTDHSMVTMTLQLNEEQKGTGFFKFNCSLLRDDEYIKRVKSVIKETICRYVVPLYEKDFIADNQETLQYTISDSLL